MDDKEKKEIHVSMDNLAMPEVHFGTKEEGNVEEEKKNIDYSGAVPEVHIKNDKGNN